MECEIERVQKEKAEDRERAKAKKAALKLRVTETGATPVFDMEYKGVCAETQTKRTDGPTPPVHAPAPIAPSVVSLPDTIVVSPPKTAALLVHKET